MEDNIYIGAPWLILRVSALENKLDKAIRILKEAVVNENDYIPAGKSGEKAPIHDKILKLLQESLEGHFRPKLGDYGIDLVIREEYPCGKLELAVEVDTGWRPVRSWLKLLDVRAAGKMWVYVPPKRDFGRADKRFEEAVRTLAKLVRSRGETANSAGRLVAIMKRPDAFRVVFLLDFERLGRLVEEAPQYGREGEG